MGNYDNDVLYRDLRDLTNESFRSWYMKAFYKLGRDRVLRLASIARSDGRDKPKYFSKLIKDALTSLNNH